MLINDRPAKIIIFGEAGVVHSQRWANWFQNQGWTVRWFSFEPIPNDQWAESLGGDRRRRALRILSSVRHVRATIRKFSPDVVSALFVPDYGWLAAMTGFHPMAVSAWGSDVLLSPKKSPLHRLRIRYVLSRADCVFADAEFMRQSLHELNVADERITIAPLGVDPEWLRSGENRTVDQSSPITVLINRRWEPLYRIDTFIEAAGVVCRDHPGRFRFTVIGNGSEAPRLRNRVAELHLEDYLSFMPWQTVDRLRSLLAGSTLYVSTSSSDATSVSLLEAMAAGCCPIVTDIPGNREWISDGENGQLFPVGDYQALAQSIVKAANRHDWLSDVGERNRSIIKARALWYDNMTVVEDRLLEAITRWSGAQ